MAILQNRCGWADQNKLIVEGSRVFEFCITPLIQHIPNWVGVDASWGAIRIKQVLPLIAWLSWCLADSYLIQQARRQAVWKLFAKCRSQAAAVVAGPLANHAVWISKAIEQSQGDAVGSSKELVRWLDQAESANASLAFADLRAEDDLPVMPLKLLR